MIKGANLFYKFMCHLITKYELNVEAVPVCRCLLDGFWCNFPVVKVSCLPMWAAHFTHLGQEL